MKLISFIAGRSGSGASSIASELSASFKRTQTPHVFCRFGGGSLLERVRADADPEVGILDVDGSAAERADDTESTAAAYLAASSVVVIPVCGGSMLPSSLEEVFDRLLETARAVQALSPQADILLVHNQRALTRIAERLDSRIEESLPDLPLLSIPSTETFSLAAVSGISAVEGAILHPASRQILSVVNAVREAAGAAPEALSNVRRAKTVQEEKRMRRRMEAGSPLPAAPVGRARPNARLHVAHVR